MIAPPRQVSVVDEDETLRESVCRAVRLANHRAVAFGDGDAAWEGFVQAPPDCVVVSLNIRGLAGAELCRRLRAQSSPVSVIAVATGGEEGMEQALAQAPGAADYLTKPFSIKALMLRLSALIRRAGLRGGEPLAWEDRPLSLGPLLADPLTLSAAWNGTNAGLTVTEFFVLHALVHRPGVVKTRDQLLQDAFPDRGSAADGTVDRIIGRMQQKFEQLEPGFDNLERVQGAGYRYRAARRRA